MRRTIAPRILGQVLFLFVVSLLNIPLVFGQVNQPAVSQLILADESPAASIGSRSYHRHRCNRLEETNKMAFLDNSSNDIIVAEKNNGTVRRVIEGVIQPEPLVDVAVANDNGTNERGLLGMAVAKQNETTTYVFLYFTESGDGRDGSDSEGIVPAGNRLYRYELLENTEGTAKLINSKLLLDLPARPGPRYNGGPLLVNQNQNNNDIIVYLMIGDLDHRETQSENYGDGPPPDGTGGILAVDTDGNPLPNPVLVEQVRQEENEDDEEQDEDEDNDDDDRENKTRE